MILLLKLAFRNVFRNFRRSLLTFLAISIGTALTILFIGFSIGMERQSIKIAVQTRMGHIKIHKKGYINDELTLSLDYTLDNYAGVLETLQRIPVEAAAARILFPASLTDGVDELRLTGIGISPDRENSVFLLSNKVMSGEYLKPGEEKILLGSSVAELFPVQTGDFLTLIARTKYGAINALDVEIAGIVHVGNPEVDNQCFFMPLDVAQDFLEMDGMATEITVRGASMESADNLADRIRQEIDGGKYDIVTWKYIARDLLNLYKMKARSRQLIIFILFLMAAAGVMNTMFMSVFERTREIGAIMAMGLRRNRVLLMFIVEGMFLGVFGSFVGCVLGGSATYYFKIYGLSLEAFGSSGFGNLPFGSVVYTHITPGYIFAAFLLGIFVAVISAAYPALKGSRLQPTEALRYV